MLVVKGSNFVHGEEFLPIFQILIFFLEVPINEIRGQTYNWFLSNVFNSFGFINFVLVLFYLCLFWTYTFFL